MLLGDKLMPAFNKCCVSVCVARKREELRLRADNVVWLSLFQCRTENKCVWLSKLRGRLGISYESTCKESEQSGT